MTLWPGGSRYLNGVAATPQEQGDCGWSQPMPLARLQAPPAQPSHPPPWPQTGLDEAGPVECAGTGIDLLKPLPVPQGDYWILCLSGHFLESLPTYETKVPPADAPLKQVLWPACCPTCLHP